MNKSVLDIIMKKLLESETMLEREITNTWNGNGFGKPKEDRGSWREDAKIMKERTNE